MNQIQEDTSTRTVSKPRTKKDRPKFHRFIHIGDSDWIDGIEYDTETQVLDAHLHSGEKYRYREIGPLLFARLVTAKSVGKEFNASIRNLAFKKLT